jgi:hypothetical protein
MGDVQVKRVRMDIEVVEPIGPLAADDVRKIVTLVLDALEQQHATQQDRQRDTRVRDRVWNPESD